MVQIKIRSNPYTREIEYTVNGKDIKESNPDCQLREIDKKRSFLPFEIKAIVDIILRDYYTGEKIEILFEGTKEEYREVEKVCQAEDIADKIILRKGQEALENARSILNDTAALFKNVQPIIEKIVRKDPGVCSDLNLVSDALDDIIPICVFGNYSSGKSTFINALIGNEILPSGGDPVTAKIYEIKRSTQLDYARIQFAYHDIPVDLKFEDGVYTVEKGDLQSDLILKLKEELLALKDESLVVLVNKALEIINAHEKVDTDTIDISSVIKVEVPFSTNGLLGKSRSNFVIFDTPGSNSASNADHAAVLKDALAGFSNGIPVWVSQYESIDSTDNEALCDLVLGIKALDNRFTMIALNKADVSALPEDGFTDKSIRTILEYNAVEKMYAAGIFFVSSVMGLGAKKDGQLHDKHYRKIFRTLKDIYADPEDEDYTSLYLYNIMPAQIKDDMCQECLAQENLIYANSGLFGIERQMEIFANKYSAYNKCQMVYAFLTDAMRETTQIIAANTEALMKLKAARESELASKQKELIDEIGLMVEEKERAFARSSVLYIMDFAKNELHYSFDREDMEKLDQQVAAKVAEITDLESQRERAESTAKTTWRHLVENLRDVIPSKSVTFWGTLEELSEDMARHKLARREHDDSQKEIDRQVSDLVLAYVIEDYRKNFMEARRILGLATESHWKNNAAQLKEILLNKVTNSTTLTESQRNRLSDVIMDFRPLDFDDDADDVFIKAKFLRGNILGFQTSERLNIRRLAARYNERLSKNIELMAEMINQSRSAAFKVWMKNLLAAVERNIVDLNPDLRQKADMIQEETEKIAEYENHRITISNALKEIETMMGWKPIDTEEMYYGR